jgi:hypothetical protein
MRQLPAAPPVSVQEQVLTFRQVEAPEILKHQVGS